MGTPTENQNLGSFMRIEKSNSPDNGDISRREFPEKNTLQPSIYHLDKNKGVEGTGKLHELLSAVGTKVPTPLKPYMDGGWKLFQVLVQRMRG